MKKWLSILLCLGLFTGCQPVVQGEPESDVSHWTDVDLAEVPADEYVWEAVGATILLPEGTMEVCDVTVAKDSGAGVIWFQFRDGGDAAFWLKAYAKDTDADSPVPEEQLGVFTLGETDTHIIQVMTSTCGTLNNEGIRPLWEEMRQKAAEMTEENIILMQ
jgi:hypothetical protein